MLASWPDGNRVQHNVFQLNSGILIRETMICELQVPSAFALDTVLTVVSRLTKPAGTQSDPRRRRVTAFEGLQMPVLQLRVAHWMASGWHLDFRCHHFLSDYRSKAQTYFLGCDVSNTYGHIQFKYKMIQSSETIVIVVTCYCVFTYISFAPFVVVVFVCGSRCPSVV